MVKVTLAKDLPSFARVSGYDVRFWYQGQPQACPVCRSYGHRVKDCPFNGLCRRCSQPGHMARECPSRRTSVVLAASTVPDPVTGADPSVSEDEADPDYVLSSASESGSCSGDEEVVRSASTAVLTSRKRSAPSGDESSVDLRDNELSPASTVPGTPESASAVVVPDSVPDPVSDPVPGTPESASAVVVPVGTPVSASAVPASTESESSVPKPKRRMPCAPAVASSLVKFFSVKSTPAKSVPAESASAESAPVESVPATTAPVPAESVPAKSAPAKSAPAKSVMPLPRSYWEVSRRSGFGRVLDDGCGGKVYFDFGRLSRSIEIESTSFEYDCFVKYVHHGYGRLVGPPDRFLLPVGSAKFPGQ